MVVLAKDARIQSLLAKYDFKVPTLEEAAPVEVHPARVLCHLFTHLGRSAKLGLSGRTNEEVGILTTSKLYKIQDKIFAFTPQVIKKTFLHTNMKKLLFETFGQFIILYSASMFPGTTWTAIFP